jgi:RNA polymerase sigma-70 factor (ECF subfamily)
MSSNPRKMPPKQEIERKLILTVAHRDHHRGLNSHAFFKVNDHATGEDMVQETFMKTWGYLVRGGKIDTMKAFLYHILNNLIVDEYRRRKHKTVSLDTLLEKGFEPRGSDNNLLNILDGKAALILISRLPKIYQKVMRMRYVQDLTLKEISLITGQSKNAIAVQIHRGLGKLKLLYK